jgi:sterol desaturase/sphingolipid hydroxylase (fatty acid hydroxylase superfamily)
MTGSAPLFSGLATIATIVVAMTAVAALELAVPLQARGRWHRTHLAPNLALTALTFATNVVLNLGLLTVVVAMERHDAGLLRWLPLPAWAAAVIAVAGLDFAFYAAHVSWHHVAWLWRFHAVHHADPAVDVTTTIRQHPVEGVLRYAAMGVAVLALGPSPTAFAVYRLASALNGLLEHANVRMPSRVDRGLSLITTWPHMHKVHHSRVLAQTNSNYGNLLSVWDRLFGTFRPSSEGTAITYGLDGFDREHLQTTSALLAQPFGGSRQPATAP